MPLTGAVTVIDLRPADLRLREPLERWTPHPVRAVSLDDIESGAHGLHAELGPLVVICERGARSGLAARYLQADGLDALAYAGGVPALKREAGGSRPGEHGDATRP